MLAYIVSCDGLAARRVPNVSWDELQSPPPQAVNRIVGTENEGTDVLFCQGLLYVHGLQPCAEKIIAI